MLDPKEDNRNKRRDKVSYRRKAGMRISMAGLRLAEILANIRRKKAEK